MEPAGARLKKIRLEKGLSLEEAQKKTKIHPNILKAIEGDTITGLNPIYLKGFLKIYCKFLGVDPKDYIPDYRETQQAVLKDFPQEAHGLNKKIIIVSISVLIVIFLAVGLFNIGKGISLKRARKLPPPKFAAVVPKKSTEVKVKKELPSSITLAISAKENCFVDLKSDGRTVFHGVLARGRSEAWKAKEKMELYLSNAGGVELQVNEQRFTSIGRKNQVIKRIVITKEGLRIPR